MTAAPVSSIVSPPPRLLLDTNIYRGLDGELQAYVPRLLRLADYGAPHHTAPRILWTCPIVVEEITCHVRVKEADRFGEIQRALWWMERLCGNLGMAEDTTWIKSAAVFEKPAAYDNEKFSIELNQMRRRVLRAQTFADVDPDDLALILRRRANFLAEHKESTDLKRTLLASAKAPLAPGDAGVEGRSAVTDLYLKTIAEAEGPNVPKWGPLKAPEEQARSVREVICYVVGHMEASRTGYSVDSKKHLGDFNDFYLCTYAGAGYYVVTSDEEFVKNVRSKDRGGCEDSRVLRLDEGLKLAEAWLES